MLVFTQRGLKPMAFASAIFLLIFLVFADFVYGQTPTPTTNLPCWSRISQRYWVAARNTTGGKVQNGDVVTVALVININDANGGGSNTWPGTCNTSGNTSVYRFRYVQTVPTGTTYATGSLKGLTSRDLVYSGGSTDNVNNLTGNFTDASDLGDDAYVSGSQVVFNLGSGATNAQGGTLSSESKPSQSNGDRLIYQAVYNVTVNAANGSTINLGGGKLYYRNTSGGTTYEYTLPDMFVLVGQNLPTNLPVDTANAITAAERGTFGTLKTTKFGDPMGDVVTGFNFTRQTEVYDNEYSLVAQTTRDARVSPPTTAPSPVNLKTNPSNNATDVVFYTAGGSGAIQGGWDVISDHTRSVNTALGNPLFDAAGLALGKGRMLMVNGSYAPATMFKAPSAGLNENTYYKVSFWIRNICNNCHNPTGISGASGDGNRSNPGVLPNVAFMIDGNIVYTTGQIPYDNPTGAFDNTASRNKWYKREFIYYNQTANSEIELELKNFAPGGGGNDFVIDDIEIHRVLPTITYNENCLETGWDGTLTGTVNSTSIPSNFDWYRWQMSDDGGATWTNVTPATQAVAPLTPANYSVDYAIVNAPSGRKYRLIAATSEANLNDAKFFAGIAVVTVDDCCKTYRIQPIFTNIWSNAANWEVYDPPTSAPLFEWKPTAVPPTSDVRVEVRTNLIQDVNYTIRKCPLVLQPNGVSKLTIAPNITLNFDGGKDGNAYFNSRPVVVQSTAAGTGAIGKMADDSKTYGDDNVTLERYIPGTKRRWNLLTFGVTSPTATIRDGWGGGSRTRVSNSSNYNNNLPLGNPPTPKPNNVPFPTPGDYVAGDATIITGHRHPNASVANSQGFDWWPELIIPKDAQFWTWDYVNSVPKLVTAHRLVTTPSSIRPYDPNGIPDSVNRGTDWYSTETLNTNYRGTGNSIVNAFLDNVEEGYMIYTRGDRQVLENWYNSTTLRPTGSIKKLDRTLAINPAPALTVFGNPYPAPIDFETLMGTGNNSSVIKEYFYTWDGDLPGTYGTGAWRTVTKVGPGNWIATPSTGVGTGAKVQYISSSQAVLLEGKSSSNASIDITEDMKTDVATVDFTPFEVEGTEDGEAIPGVLFADLHSRGSAGELSVVDGAAIIIGNGYKADATDSKDIRKVFNFNSNANYLALGRDGKMLAFEAHPVPTSESVFYLVASGLEKAKYSFTFRASDLVAAGSEVFLKDKFLGTLTPISMVEDTRYDFEGTNDTLSQKADRFEIVFRKGEILPVTFTHVQAVELEGNVKVSWSVATEKNLSHYEVEHSRNGVDFGKAIRVEAKNTSPASYDWLHVQPGSGNHFYKVRGVDLDGKFNTSKVVKVTIGSGKPGFVAFPTLVNEAAQVSLQMNSMKAGDYVLQVTDMNGRVVKSQKITLGNGSSSQVLQLPASLQAGRYNIKLKGDSGEFLQVIVKD